jgi:hypothetical protein
MVTNLVVAILLLGSATSVYAQERDAAAAALREIPANTRVMISSEGKRYVGVITGNDGVLLRLRSDRLVIEVPISTADTIWKRGNRARQGVVYGAAAGSIVFGISAYQFALANAETRGQHLLAIPVGAILGVGVGGLIGLAIGQSIPRWQLFLTR